MTITYSKKAFLAATLLAIAILSSVMVAYGEVTVSSTAPLQGTVKYSLDNAATGTWNTTVAPASPLTPWYSRLEINGAGYNGPVIVTWKLQQNTGPFSWTDVPGAAISTSMTLSGSEQTIYATNDGAYSQSNYNWGQNITASGTYRVVVTITA